MKRKKLDLTVEEQDIKGNEKYLGYELFGNTQIFQSLTTNFPHSFLFILDPDLKISFVSGQEIESRNIDPNLFIGQTIEQVFRTGNHQFTPQLEEAFLGQPIDCSVTWEDEYFQIKMVPLNDQEITNHVLVIAENISEQKKVEEELGKRILTLTQPLNSEIQVSFEELFDLTKLQQIQDSFAQATGVGSVITRPDGTPITRPSNFCYLCNDIIRKTPQGRRNCYLSDAILGRHNPSGPIIQTCLSGGLWDAGASITVEGRHIANWLIGQVRDETQNEENMRKYASIIQADENEVINAFRKVPKMTRKHFEEISEALFILADQLSTLAYNNIQQSRFISEVKAAEAELIKINEEVKNYFSSTIELIVICDKDGNIKRLNPECEKILGYETVDLINKKAIDLIHPDDLQKNLEIFKKINKQNQIIESAGRYRRKDGSYRWIEWRISAIQDLIYCSGRDITQSIEDERAIKENLEKFKAIFPSMSEGCGLNDIVYDENGSPVNFRITEVNPAYERILGVCADDVRGKLASEVYGDEILSYLEGFSQVASGGAPYHMTTYFGPMKKYFDVSVSSPGPGQFATIFFDITQRVMDQEEIKLMNQTLEKKVVERTSELELMNNELEAFAYSVSHDLRAPLRSIDGFSQIILEDYSNILPEDGRHYLSQVRKATQQMGTLIDDMLRLSRIMRVDINQTEIDLSEMARQIIANLKLQHPNRQIEVSIEKGMRINGDHNLIQIGLENLINNAWKFTSKKIDGRIEIGSAGENKFFVRDNGAGFDMAYVKKLFGPFQRLHSTDEFEGTGIGLAIVQRIFQRHGGQVWAESTVNQGATFWFTIPMGGNGNGNR